MTAKNVIWKRIVVLANSFKYQGRCVAGKELSSDGNGNLIVGPWVRPVTDSLNGELSFQDFRLDRNSEPRLVDIVDVPVVEQVDDPIQPENWLVAAGIPWKRVGQLPTEAMDALVDESEGLWDEPGAPTDSVSAQFLRTRVPTCSLKFIRIEQARISSDGRSGFRLGFHAHGVDYQLKITDPAIYAALGPRLRGLSVEQSVSIKNITVCFSLGNEFASRHYKLAAAIVFPETGRELLTIGHSNRDIDDFTELLIENNVDIVADVRSHPVSRRFPHFSKKSLQVSLRDRGIRYVFLGKELGARPDIHVEVDEFANLYRAQSETAQFRSGIERLIEGVRCYRVALLCAEKDPLLCHRTILICRNLWHLGLDIAHIIDEGRLEQHPVAESRLMLEENVRAEQVRMFGRFEEYTPLDLAYDRRAEKIALRGRGTVDEALHNRVHEEER